MSFSRWPTSFALIITLGIAPPLMTSFSFVFAYVWSTFAAATPASTSTVPTPRRRWSGWTATW